MSSPADPNWPIRMRTDDAADYLQEDHQLPVTAKQLRAYRGRPAWRRAGPACRYLGPVALYDRTELDRWAREDALQPENPTARTRRLAALALAAA